MKIPSLSIILLIILSLSVHGQGVRLDLNNPPAELTIFGQGVISTSINERDFAISPDGSEMYFTISSPKSTIQTIVYCRKLKDGKWTRPEVAPFAGSFSDLEPAFSVDGQTLFFSSNRPTTGNQKKDFDIWKVGRTNHGWSAPENIGAPVNTVADEFYPSIAKNGNLYFTAQYEKGIGKEDIYVSIFRENKYMEPHVLDTAVNSAMYEFNAFVSPEEDYILFTSYGRKNDKGGGDVYISVKSKEGKWLPARSPKELNSPQLDYCPYVSPDGKILFLTSERHQLPVSVPNGRLSYNGILELYQDQSNGYGNIYWIDFSKVIDK